MVGFFQPCGTPRGDEDRGSWRRTVDDAAYFDRRHAFDDEEQLRFAVIVPR
jgi:hypothetical protein